ncbi:predicted protein [Naegleria gruberi]|uniref:Predicted protein n=1 Tax=Naegleria gruberi TaxID=5762 RepID=D2W0P0_NAEGR|nr:uncharacterized protein NAEGRDRAFT_74928 [Naegleria gruberi]EFC37370.1 predicted protein [Naegleria gruberi]|eukprot:XP_002670114.1 predicted protein [Naegleria gruberi strain NEG-M]
MSKQCSPVTLDDPLSKNLKSFPNNNPIEDDHDEGEELMMIREEKNNRINNTSATEQSSSILLDEESDEENSLLKEGATTSSNQRSCSSFKNQSCSDSNKKDMVQLHTQIPAYYLRIGKHMIVFIGIMILCAISSGFVFRELTKNSVPFSKVGDYAYQQGSLIHGHFFSLGVFVPLTLVVLLFLSYVMTGEKVSSGMFHVGFIIYEIGAVLALAAFCYKAGSFLSFIKRNPKANIHEFELYTWGGTSSYGGKNDGTGDMSMKMIRMLYFAISHGFMLIGLFKCVIIIFISIFRKKKL